MFGASAVGESGDVILLFLILKFKMDYQLLVTVFSGNHNFVICHLSIVNCHMIMNLLIVEGVLAGSWFVMK
jgi:hypothetical protein